MRKSLIALLAATAAAVLAPRESVAQGVYVGAGPVGVGVGVGVGPGYYGYGSGYYGYGPGYYGYGPDVRYRSRVVTAPRYRYYSAPRRETNAERVPGGCGEYFYWDGGRCVDSRLKTGR